MKIEKKSFLKTTLCDSGSEVKSDSEAGMSVVTAACRFRFAGCSSTLKCSGRARLRVCELSFDFDLILHPEDVSARRKENLIFVKHTKIEIMTDFLPAMID